MENKSIQKSKKMVSPVPLLQTKSTPTYKIECVGSKQITQECDRLALMGSSALLSVAVMPCCCSARLLVCGTDKFACSFTRLLFYRLDSSSRLLVVYFVYSKQLHRPRFSQSLSSLKSYHPINLCLQQIATKQLARMTNEAFYANLDV